MALNHKLKYVVLRDKPTGKIEDICEISYRSEGTMSPARFILHRVNEMLNPFYSSEESYETIDPKSDNAYNPKKAQAFYDCFRITEKELPIYLKVFNPAK